MQLPFQIVQFGILQLIDILELSIAVIFSYVLALYVSFKYKENKTLSLLLFILFFLFLGTALLSLAVQRSLLYFANDQNSRLIIHHVALYCSLVDVALFDMFSFEMTYPDKLRNLTIIVAIVLTFLGVFLLFNQPSIDINGDMIYSTFVYIVLLPSLIPLLIIPNVVFSYYSYIVRSKSRPNSLRVAVMEVAQIIITVTYVVELINIHGIAIFIIRSGFLIYGVLMYICLTMPDWFKRKIGME